MTRDPFFLTPAEIGKLTLRQLELVYARDPAQPPRRESRQNSGPAAAPVQSYQELFYGTWRKRGLTEAAIDVRWAAYLEENRGRKRDQPR